MFDSRSSIVSLVSVSHKEHFFHLRILIMVTDHRSSG